MAPSNRALLGRKRQPKLASLVLLLLFLKNLSFSCALAAPVISGLLEILVCLLIVL